MYIPAMQDMRRTPEEKEEASESMAMPMSGDYPYGLSICLCQDELDKLNLDDEEVAIGDILHFHALAKVTSISRNDHEASGKNIRVELQITNMSAESEDEENKRPLASQVRNRMYKK